MKLLSALDHSSRPRNRARELDNTSPSDLADLAIRIDRDGLDTVAPSTLTDLVRRAGLAGFHPEVAAILTDPNAPAVVRARAFGLIHRRLAVTPVGTDPVAVAA